MDIREKYRRFRTWQKASRTYSVKDTSTHRCNNCDHEFTGNYCPVCGQKATWGRITWASVRENVMLLWGMESHSMPYTLYQLMLRPGYLIGEYISGRRQVSYPPVKMLFVVAVVYAIIKQLLGIEIEPLTAKEEKIKFIVIVINWLKANPGWGMMTLTIFLIIPTWFFFRFAPRYPRHSLPESFFIQIFMSSLMLICLLLSEISEVLMLLIPFYYYITYRQLFGYRFWGTTWRLLLALIVWFTFIAMLAVTIILFSDTQTYHSLFDQGGVVGVVGYFLVFLGPIAAILFIGYWISRMSEKRRNKAK